VTGALRRVEPGLEIELVPIRTSGDERAPSERRASPPGEHDTASAPSTLGDKSRFVKEIEEALLAGDVDLAVHSAKDVPGELPDGLALVGVPPRADPRDALCGAPSLEQLAEGARVGTSSLRRRAQLLAVRPDVRVEELRGNVDTRLRKLAAGEHDAIVLAAAGLARLGVKEGEPISTDVLTPAAGQGCLVLECRADDERAGALAGLLTEHESLLCLTAERACVTSLEATCRTPVAAYAALADGALTLDAFAGLPDGSSWIRERVAGAAEEAASLGAHAAARMLAAGAADMLDEAERSAV
jgi:hydroxymethylbilane synthase